MRQRIKKPPLSQATYDHTKQPGEKVSDEIVTIPGQTMSIREMYARGAQIPEVSGNYDEEADYDDDVGIRTPGFDLSDLDKHKENLEIIDKAVKAKKAKDEKDKQKKELRAEIEAENKKNAEHSSGQEKKGENEPRDPISGKEKGEADQPAAK